MSRAELDTAYGGKHISIEHMPNLVALMDLFCLSEVLLTIFSPITRQSFSIGLCCHSSPYRWSLNQRCDGDALNLLDLMVLNQNHKVSSNLHQAHQVSNSPVGGGFAGVLVVRHYSAFCG
jgi:hypothetical protein